MAADPTRPGRLPNLVIAGVSKAGTTSLFDYLGQHPDIGTSDVKELRYFTPLRYGAEPGPVDEYASHFSRCLRERYALEATPGYFYGGARLARGLDGSCPDARVLVSLREPAQRCWSWYGFVKSRLRIPKQMTFEEYLDRCEELHRADVDGTIENQPFWGLGGGCYATWLADWTKIFGDRFRLLFFDDLAAEPAHVVRSVCEWLELDPTPVDGFQFEVDNRTRQYRNERLQQVAVGINRRSERFFRRHRSVKGALRRGYYAVNRAASETMPAGAEDRLREFYGPYNARLAEQLGPLGLTLPAAWARP